MENKHLVDESGRLFIEQQDPDSIFKNDIVVYKLGMNFPTTILCEDCKMTVAQGPLYNADHLQDRVSAPIEMSYESMTQEFNMQQHESWRIRGDFSMKEMKRALWAEMQNSVKKSMYPEFWVKKHVASN